MQLTDVRRLTGASLILDRPGAVGEVVDLPHAVSGPVLTLWCRWARDLLEAVGWGAESVAVRPYPEGASIAVSAPIDGLYAATDLIEHAWEMTQATLDGGAPDQAAIVAELVRGIDGDADSGLVALAEAAQAHGVAFLAGEDQVSIGLGTRGRCWPDNALPEPAAIDWQSVGDIPVAMVTGTNGKSTTVRLTATIAAAAGRVAGQSSSDWVRVGGETIDTGDYSGPSGARQAARDPRTEIAILETARGGLMRRGLAFAQADVCLITNVAADHLGDYGIVDVPTLAEAKFLIARAVKRGGRLVLNADDPELVRRGAQHAARHGGDIAWFSLEPDNHRLDAWIAAGGAAAILRDGWLVLARGGETIPVLEVGAFPLGMGGAARFNLSNALGAICLAEALGLPVKAMRDGLGRFTGSPDENPGRGNFFDLGGVTVVVDFAHNPHGVAAFLGALAALPAKRRAVLAGQAGDRSDADTAEMVRVIWESGPDLVVVKELLGKLRGRKPGEVPAVIEAELHRLGATDQAIARTGDEIEAVRVALQWAQPGDMLVLLIHDDRQAVMALLDHLQQRAWRPGDPLDAAS